MDIFIQWLIANSLKGAVLIIAVFLVQFVFSKQIPPKWKYLMWLLVAVRLIMPSLLELDSSIFNLKNIWQNETVNSIQSDLTQQNQVAIIVQDSKQVASVEVVAFWKRIELSSILFFVWASVSIFLFLYLFWKNLSILALVRKEKPIVKSNWLELLENCKQELKLYTPVQLVETSHIKTPALMGFVRPRILLPTGILNAMTESEIRLIFMHELTHLKCGDIIINWTISLIQIVHWFNPFVWIAFSKTREARELACDDDMLSFLGRNDSKKYGQTIIKLLDLCYNENRITGMVGILENKKQINRRIKMIKNRNRKTKRGVVFALILLTVMGTVFLSEAKEKKKTIEANGKKEVSQILHNVKGDHCNIVGKNIIISGNAYIPYGKFIVYADKATFNIENKDLKAFGNVRVHVLDGKQEKNKIFKAKSVTGNLASGYLKFVDFTNRQENAILKADSCILNPDGKITVENGKLVTTKKAEKLSIRQKLKSIIIPSLDLESATVKTAVQFLNRLGKRYDPNGVGVNIILMVSDSDLKKPVDLVLKKKSLYDAIYFLCKASGLRFRIQKNLVLIADKTIVHDGFETKTFQLKPGALAAAGVDNSAGIKKYFEDRGVKFPAGAELFYARQKTPFFIMKNTRDNINRVESIVQNELNKTKHSK